MHCTSQAWGEETSSFPGWGKDQVMGGEGGPIRGPVASPPAPRSLHPGVSPRKLRLWIWREEAVHSLRHSGPGLCVRHSPRGSFPSYTLSVCGTVSAAPAACEMCSPSLPPPISPLSLSLLSFFPLLCPHFCWLPFHPGFLCSLPFAPFGFWSLPPPPPFSPPPPPPPPTGSGHPSPGCDYEVERRVPWKPRLHTWNRGHVALVPVTHLTCCI